MKLSPRVSVIMPVYNGARFLLEAIDSILSQTFDDFELIIINDGSTDDSVAVIDSYRDARIRVVNHESNKGLVFSRNEGIRLARAEFIAWLDCDDVSEMTRLEKQVNFLTDNPNVGLLGSWVSLIDENGVYQGCNWQYETESDVLSILLLFKNRFVQSTVMVRREILTVEMYREEYPLAEDYDLWVRISKCTKIANFPENLVRYRLHGNSISRERAQEMEVCVERIICSQLTQLEVQADRSEIELHRYLGREMPINNLDKLNSILSWVKVLVEANNTKNFFESGVFRKVLERLWFQVCYRSTHIGMKVIPLYFSLPGPLLRQVSLLKYLRFFLRAIINRA